MEAASSDELLHVAARRYGELRSPYREQEVVDVKALCNALRYAAGEVNAVVFGGLSESESSAAQR
jgi:hypothetical protein